MDILSLVLLQSILINHLEVLFLCSLKCYKIVPVLQSQPVLIGLSRTLQKEEKKVCPLACTVESNRQQIPSNLSNQCFLLV